MPGWRTRRPACSDDDDGPGGEDETAFEQAVNAAGGAAALEGLDQIQIDATGDRGVDYEATEPGGVMAVSTYLTSYKMDLSNDDLRLDTVRTPLFEALQFFPMAMFSVVLNGDVGALSDMAAFAAPGNMPSQQVAALKVQQRLLNPHVYLRDGLADPTLLGDGGMADVDGRAHRIVTFAGQVSVIRLFVDAETGFITKLETVENNLLARDHVIEVRYRDWQAQGGVAFPNEIEMRAAGTLVLSETRTAVDTAPTFAADTFDLPPSADNPTLDAEAFAFGRQSHQSVDAFFNLAFYYVELPGVPTSTLAPGITFIPSAANSLAVETDQGLVLIEAPNTPAHGTALVEALAGLFPSTPITHAIVSHHHQDHASGVRSLAAVGATVVVGNGVASLWNDVLTAESTVRPDALAAANVTPNIEEISMGGTFVISDANVTITSHHLAGNEHAADMVMTVVDLGAQKFVYQADLYNAGFGLTFVLGGPEALFEALRDLDIIDGGCTSAVPLTIVPAHGVPTTLAEALAELDGLDIDVGCP